MSRDCEKPGIWLIENKGTVWLKDTNALIVQDIQKYHFHALGIL